MQDYTKNQNQYDMMRAMMARNQQPTQGANAITALGKILSAYFLNKGMSEAEHGMSEAKQGEEDTRNKDLANILGAYRSDQPYVMGEGELMEGEQPISGLSMEGTGQDREAMIQAMMGAKTPSIQDLGMKHMLAQKTQTPPNMMGKYNPGDYTMDTWSEFVKGGMQNPSKLNRYEPAWIGKIGGVPAAANKADPTQPVVPLSTQQAELGWEKALVTAKADAAARVKEKVTQKVQGAKLDAVNRIYDKLSESDLSLIYGKGEKWYPEFFRSQKGIDLIADRDQLIAMLAMGARGELKGQGTITDNETLMLEKAVTTLQNPNISPEKAKEALDSAKAVLFRSAGKEVKKDTRLKAGTVEDGYKFKGGDPSKSENWEKVGG